MKVLSMYFSATGGTETFQRIVQKVCENYDIEFTEIDVTNNKVGVSEKWLDQFDAYLIGSPIIFCSAPQSIQNILKTSFNHGLNKKVVLYSTSATGKNSTIYGFANLLKSRGYIVTGIVNIRSINNFYYSDTLKVKNINSKNTVVEEFELQARVIKELLMTSTNLNALQSFSPIRHFIYTTFYAMLRPMFIRGFSLRNFQVLPDRCNGCAICKKRCPNSNIDIHKNRPVFKSQCFACSRCIQCCPTNAISYKNRSIKQMNHITLIDFQKDYHF